MAITQIQQRNKVYDFDTYKTTIPAAGEILSISNSSKSSLSVEEVMGDGVHTIEQILDNTYILNVNIPTAGQKAGLAGTSGTVSDTNRYVTQAGIAVANVFVQCSAADMAVTSATPLALNTLDYDPLDTVDTTAGAWKFTAPITGLYDITTYFEDADTFDVTASAELFVDGSNTSITMWDRVSGHTRGGRTIKYRLTAGQYIDFRPIGSDSACSVAIVQITRLGY